MKSRILALLISAMTVFSGITAQAADAENQIVVEIDSQTYDANVALPSPNYTGIVPGYDGNFYLYNNGKFASSYSGLYGDAVYGWWLITNGVVNLGYNDLYGDATLGWWKVANGTVDFGYTGLYTSPTVGTWYIVGGCVDLSRGPQQTTTQNSVDANLKAISSQYSYYVSSDFRRMKSRWSTARLIGAYCYPYIEEDGDVWIFSYVSYAVGNVKDEELNAYNLSKGTYIHDPADAYKKQANRTYGATSVAYLKKCNFYLEIERYCIEQIRQYLLGNNPTNDKGTYVCQ